MITAPLHAWVLLLLAGLGAAWLWWRHTRLLRAIHRYAAGVRGDPASAEPESAELRALARAIREQMAVTEDSRMGVQAERDRLAAVLGQMTDGVLIVDEFGEIRYSNPAAARLFQLDGLRARSLTEALRDFRLVDVWKRSQSTGSLQTESLELPVTRQFVQLVVVPDSHDGGSLVLVQDLTRMRRLETVRQDFVSNISHELRTPLASLRALAETLIDGAIRDPLAAPRFLRQIMAEVDALTQMSQELLDLVSIESGKAELHLAEISPRQLLDAAADRMRVQAERASLNIEVKCQDDLPAVRADPSRLGQVLVNLIHNAIKFTGPGGQISLSAGSTMIESDAHARAVDFVVVDTGRGIPPDDLPRIFERFYRGDKSRSGGGTGLGLSISRHIVEAHGGRIWAESLEGRGSTFHFTIPLSDSSGEAASRV